MSTLRFQEVELSKFPRPCGHFCQVEFVPVSAGSVGRTVDTVAFRCMTSSSTLAILRYQDPFLVPTPNPT
jgi:hypothetical protein